MKICVGTVDSCDIIHTALHRVKLLLGITASHKLYMIRMCPNDNKITRFKESVNVFNILIWKSPSKSAVINNSKLVLYSLFSQHQECHTSMKGREKQIPSNFC